MLEVLNSSYQKTRISTGLKYPWVHYKKELYSPDYGEPTVHSVDTGSFVPGVYRVNPYSISSYVAKLPKYSFEYPEQNATYSYLVTNDGSGLFSYNLIRTMASVVSLHSSPSDFWGRIALQKAYAAVSGGVATYGVELGELKETLSMLRNPLRGLRRLFDSYHLRRLTRRDLDSVVDQYLEFRFALIPLYNAILEAIDLVSQGLPSFERGKIYSLNSMVRAPAEEISAGSIATVSAVTAYRGTMKVTKKVCCNGSVQARYEIPPGISDMLGLSPLDLPAIAWELTRLSFIVDRFLAIGPWIESLRFTPGAQTLGNTLGVKVILEATVTDIEYKFYYGTEYKKASGIDPAVITYKSYNRSVNVPLSGQPAINWELSQSIIQLIDEIALLYKALK